MSHIHQTAIVTNANSRFGIWTIEAIVPAVKKIIAVVRPGDLAERGRLAELGAELGNVEIAEVDIEVEDNWQAFCGNVAASEEPVDLLIHAAPFHAGAISTEQAIAAHVVAPWLAAKYALNLMRSRGTGIVIIQAARPQPRAGVMSLHDGEVEALRISNAALLQDASKVGTHLRLNRLLFDDSLMEQSFKSAVRVLQDARSSFMTGAELVLTASHDISASRREDLVGKTVLITGATSGIGRAAAIEAGRLGAWVAVGGRKPHLAEETLSLVREAGGDGMFVPLDVTRAEDWQNAIAAIVAARGVLDGLVNNAGEARNKHIDELNATDLDFLLSVNYRACLLGMTEGAQAMQAFEGGSIVNITSVAGLRGGPGGSAYGTSKAGAIGLSRAFAAANRDVSPLVRVNALQPGFIWSDSVVDSLGVEGAERFRTMIEPKTPLGRVGQPAEIARMICFLLSDAAAAINGQTVNVSGGLELTFP